jgi:DNA-binding transcriptional regulator PaaX
MFFYAKTSSGAYKFMRDLVRLISPSKDLIFDYSGLPRLSDRVSKKRWKYLENAGYIEPIEEGKYRFTDMAKLNLLREIVAKREPDGKQRMVVFDIPEKKRAYRDVFRRSLKEMDFKMIQRSVWVSHKPCEDLVELLVKEHKLGRFTKLLVGEVVTLS